MKKIELEVGDSFIIDWRSFNKMSPCKYPDKKFIIKKIKGQLVIFDDFRTNKKCKCRICKYSHLYNYPLGEEAIEKEIYKDYVIVTEKKLERERDRKLKLILGKYENR